MARRQKTSLAEDLMALVAGLPWWAGVALALLFYLVLHRIAGEAMAAAVQPGQLGAMATQTLWKTLASFGQYILPLICLAGAGISAWKRRERKALVANVVQSDAADVLDGMSWQQFEQLVGEAFRLKGPEHLKDFMIRAVAVPGTRPDFGMRSTRSCFEVGRGTPE